MQCFFFVFFLTIFFCYFCAQKFIEQYYHELVRNVKIYEPREKSSETSQEASTEHSFEEELSPYQVQLLCDEIVVHLGATEESPVAQKLFSR